MLLADARSMRDADDQTIHMMGVPSTLLMTNAAAAVGRAAMEYLRPGGSAIVFCGPGNNGGDGIAAAAWLLRRGILVRAILVGSREKMSADAREMERRLHELGGVLETFAPTDALLEAISHADVVIDSIFGIGLSRPLSGDALRAVEMINASAKAVVSADIATGVTADTGAIMGNAVRATKTVTFSMAKPGHFAAPGCTYCGELEVAPIGIPGELLRGSRVYAVTETDLYLPKRALLAHKSDFGKLLVVGGSVGYTGAPTLCARAALRAGAGLVSLGVPEPIYSITAVKNDEAMPFPLAADEDGKLSEKAIPVLLQKISGMDAAVIGPGIGRSEALSEMIPRLVRESPCPLVLDADGLNAIVDDMAALEESRKPVILTPHAGEFARLGGSDTGDPIRDAVSFARAHNCVLVRKGHATICAFPDGEAFINTTGGPALAKGGSGDVLAGMIAALLCRLPLKEAVITAVWLHGRAGDLCAEDYGEDSVLAGDVIANVSRAMREIRKQ